MKLNRPMILAVLALVSLAQMSFFPALPVFKGGWTLWLNPTAAIVAVVVLFEKRKNGFGWAVSILGGLLLDFYSGFFFGFWVLIFLAIAAFVKFVLKKYARIPSFW